MTDPISEYFSTYSARFNFTPDDDWRQIDQFNSLAMEMGWDQPARAHEFSNLRRAWADFEQEEFGGRNLENYQFLCEILKIDPIPESIKQCKSELRRVHVNIVDLMQSRWDNKMGRGPSYIPKFSNAHELREYTEQEGKKCPSEIAKTHVVRVLLR
jgi:hypothetical protein